MNKDFAELKKLPAESLEAELIKVRQELVKLYAQLATGAASKEVGKVHNLKKRVARIKTLQRMGGIQK